MSSKSTLLLINIVLVLFLTTVSATTYYHPYRPVCRSLNQKCGGFVHYPPGPPKCCTGLTCKLNPSIPDAPGYCVLPKPKCRTYKQHCGGQGQYPAKCCTGFTCKHSSPYAPGICLPNTEPQLCQTVHQSCGGFTQYPKKCCPNLRCKTNPRIPDLPGVCVPPY